MSDERNDPARTGRETPARGARWGGVMVLGALPIVLAILGFYGPVFGGARLVNRDQDFTFYAYQLKHAAEAGGRWWKVSDDDKLGNPYQSEIARHPGLFEGVDLMLLCALPGRWLDSVRLYHLAALFIFATNGWVVGRLVYRKTGSYAWACAGVVLITSTVATFVRGLTGELHTAKHGFVLLTVWAFANYLSAPSLRRGILLGLAAAGVLQGSFYSGYLLALTLLVWWLGCLASRRIDRRHVAATALAALAFSSAAAALVFPVWTVARKRLLSDGYFVRRWGETWRFGAELWQYFVPNYHELGQRFIAETTKPAWVYGEGWFFPGYTALAAAALYVVARLSGFRFPRRYAALLDVLMGVAAVAVVLSLAGGPGFFLFHVFPSFRVYGRAGLITTAATCAAAPLVLHAVLESVRPGWARFTLGVGVVALIAVDGLRPAQCMNETFYRTDVYDGNKPLLSPQPEWVAWLARQPARVRLAAFEPKVNESFYEWGVKNLRARMDHGHTTLNGSDFTLLNADLALLGASYERLNPRALRFIVSLGYDHLAFHVDYLEAHPWLEALPDLDWVETLGPWRIARPSGRMAWMRCETLENIVSCLPAGSTPARVPPAVWITGGFDLDADVVVTGRSRALVVWAGPDGKWVGTPSNVLFQHVYGPGLPAYSVKTPDQPGRYDLVFLDTHRRPLASRPYRVDASLRTTTQAFGDRVPDVAINYVDWFVGTGPARGTRVVVENASRYYVQAQVDRESAPRSVRAHPGIRVARKGSLGFWLHADARDGSTAEVELRLPRDLAPGERMTLDIAADDLFEPGAMARLSLTPTFLDVGNQVTPLDRAEMRLTLAPASSSDGFPARRDDVPRTAASPLPAPRR